MNLKEYAERLNALVKQGYGKLELVYASDDEGNDFRKVLVGPAIGTLNSDGSFIMQTKENEDMWPEGKEADIVCIN